ncbi:MAG TPA: T9SS type A sorting domain-containing protein [Chitinophagales bacterium]|nr:T9SS type A sorting domain-containing protein [Chitinophagales bacterium]
MFYLKIKKQTIKALLSIRGSFIVAGLMISLSITICKFSTGQIICIFCYDQNVSISSGVNNLLLNGGFENTTCAISVDCFCPNANNYSCDIDNWICTGGGTNTIARIWDSTYSTIVEGTKAAYPGNFFCQACSPIIDDTSCLINSDCTITGIPVGYPVNTPAQGGTTGVSLEQTVTGLIPGNTYVLEFWAGGFDGSGWNFPNTGLFAVDVGFGDTMLRCKPTPPTANIGTTYIIEFNAVASTHTIKFTNWGHICNDCTEIILDNVRLYTLAELSSSVPYCSGSSSLSSFAASDTDLCEKFCINFFDSSGNNPTSWLWLFPGGNPSYSALQNPINICYNLPGTYDVTLITTTANGIDTLTLPNYITVYPTPPFPTITQLGYTLTSSVAISYQWQLNSVNIPGATNQSYSVLQSGLYTVVVGDANGCVNSANKYVLITGVDEVSDDENIFIFPNPSNGHFMIEWLNGPDLVGMAGEVSIDVVNTLGQKVFPSSESRSIGNNSVLKTEIDLCNGTTCDVSTGVYFIEIKTQTVFLKKKIIIMK